MLTYKRLYVNNLIFFFDPFQELFHQHGVKSWVYLFIIGPEMWVFYVAMNSGLERVLGTFLSFFLIVCFLVGDIIGMIAAAYSAYVGCYALGFALPAALWVLLLCL